MVHLNSKLKKWLGEIGTDGGNRTFWPLYFYIQLDIEVRELLYERCFCWFIEEGSFSTV